MAEDADGAWGWPGARRPCSMAGPMPGAGIPRPAITSTAPVMCTCPGSSRAAGRGRPSSPCRPARTTRPTAPCTPSCPAARWAPLRASMSCRTAMSPSSATWAAAPMPGSPWTGSCWPTRTGSGARPSWRTAGPPTRRPTPQPEPRMAMPAYDSSASTATVTVVADWNAPTKTGWSRAAPPGPPPPSRRRRSPPTPAPKYHGIFLTVAANGVARLDVMQDNFPSSNGSSSRARAATASLATQGRWLATAEGAGEGRATRCQGRSGASGSGLTGGSHVITGAASWNTQAVVPAIYYQAAGRWRGPRRDPDQRGRGRRPLHGQRHARRRIQGRQGRPGGHRGPEYGGRRRPVGTYRRTGPQPQPPSTWEPWDPEPAISGWRARALLARRIVGGVAIGHRRHRHRLLQHHRAHQPDG